MSINFYANHFDDFLYDLESYRKKSDYASSLDYFLEKNLVGRVRSVSSAIVHTLHAAINLPLCMVEHTIGAVLTLNKRQAITAWNYGKAFIVTLIALPIIGFIGFFSLEKAVTMAQTQSDYYMKKFYNPYASCPPDVFKPKYPQAQARIMCLVLTLTTNLRSIPIAVIDSVDDLFSSTVFLGFKIISNTASGLKASYTASRGDLKELGIPLPPKYEMI